MSGSTTNLKLKLCIGIYTERGAYVYGWLIVGTMHVGTAQTAQQHQFTARSTL